MSLYSGGIFVGILSAIYTTEPTQLGYTHSTTNFSTCFTQTYPLIPPKFFHIFYRILPFTIRYHYNPRSQIVKGWD